MTEVGKLLLTELQEKHKLYKSGADWHGLRCPFCGDSSHDPKAHHLYVRIPSDDKDKLYGIKCFKPGCGKAGVLNIHDLVKLGVKSRAVHEFIRNNEITSDELIYKTEKRVLTEVTLNGCDDIKYPSIVDYFKGRTNFDLSDIYNEIRMIPNIKAFIDINKHLITDKKDKRWGYLYNHPEDCVCFINKTKTRIFVRYINNPRKHDKIDIIKYDFLFSHANYSIEKSLGVGQITGLRGYIGEGLFDIINMYLNYSDNKSSIYEATGGIEGFTKAFMNMSREYYDIIWMFLQDADVNDIFFKNLYNKNKYRFKYNPFVIHSKNTKDLGDVRDNPIIETVQLY